MSYSLSQIGEVHIIKTNQPLFLAKPSTIRAVNILSQPQNYALTISHQQKPVTLNVPHVNENRYIALLINLA